MEFPITREALQNFNRAAAQEKKEKEQRYDFYKTLIKYICKDVENKMMTSQQILNNSLGLPQNFNPQHDTGSVLNATQYVWKDIGILAHWPTLIHTQNQNYDNAIQYYKRNNLGKNGYNVNHAKQFNQSLPEFIEMLKETFIGCDIIVDPLKTYLIIDWS